MSRKGENIFKRKDGRWEARYIKGYDISGKARYGYCYGRTYTEARRKVATFKAAITLGSPIPSFGRQRLSIFCREWLEVERGKVRDSTYVKYRTILNRHILPGLGGCFPTGLTTLAVEQFKQDLLGKGLSVKTVRDILTVLRSILKYTSAQIPGFLPAVEITYPKEPRKEPRVLTLEEQRKFMDYLRTDTDACRFGILLAMLTGLRIGELCALRWENICYRDATLKISATMQRLPYVENTGGVKTHVAVGSPKSDTSIRVIPLTDSLLRLCRRFDPHLPKAYILTGAKYYMEPRKLQRRLAEFTSACGLTGVHFHTLRHTFATRCVEVGFEIKSLSEILGHASTSITMNRYVHSSMELKRENMDKLAAAGLVS